MGFYYGEVVVRNFPGLRWRVQQFGFATNKYELQVVSGRFAEGIGCFRDLFRKPKNRRPWKAFERWASQIELEKRYPVPEKIDLKGELFDEDRTNSLPSYPPFLGPPQLRDKEPEKWSREEADLNLEWLKGVIKPRSENLLSYFNVIPGNNRENTLYRLGKELARVAWSTRFVTTQGSTTDPDYRLTDEGYALTADIGLLLARYVLEECPNTDWEIVRKPKKHVSYNLPVLKGTEHMDPMLSARVEFFALLNGERTPDAWAAIFRRWTQNLSQKGLN